MSCGRQVLELQYKFDVGYAVNELSDGYVAGGGLYKDGFQKSAIVKLDFNGNIVRKYLRIMVLVELEG